jgi:hypothetical protein
MGRFDPQKSEPFRGPEPARNGSTWGLGRMTPLASVVTQSEGCLGTLKLIVVVAATLFDSHWQRWYAITVL